MVITMECGPRNRPTPIPDVPSTEECEAILARNRVPPGVVAHSRAVTCVALEIALTLVRTGLELDLDLVAAGAMLHDLAKGQPDHARAGARMLAAMGYHAVALVVGDHLDAGELTPDQPLTESHIVFLADKLVQGTRLVTVGERYAPGLDRFAENPEAFAGATRRLRRAQALYARVEAALGTPLETLPLLAGQLPAGDPAPAL
jgi:putative nucleotidyltransferase with HDIG domain